MSAARHLRVALLALSATALLAACSTGTDGHIDPAAIDVTARPPAPKPSGAETYATATVEEASPTPDAIPTFGQQGDWEDGLAGTVKAVKRASFGQSAYPRGGPGMKVTIQITNGSVAAVDLFPTLGVRLGVQGGVAEEVYAEGCDTLTDLGRLAPGRTVSATLCFAGRAPTVDVSFSPSADYDALTWTGKVA